MQPVNKAHPLCMTSITSVFKVHLLVNIKCCCIVFYHQAGDDDDKDGEEEDNSIKTLSVPHVIPLLTLQDVLLQRESQNKFITFQNIKNRFLIVFHLLTVCDLVQVLIFLFSSHHIQIFEQSAEEHFLTGVISSSSLTAKHKQQ